MIKFDFSKYLLLVTGFGGFLGSRLVDILLKSGATVIGIKLNYSINEEKIKNHEQFYLKELDEKTEKFINDKKFKSFKTFFP